LVNNFNTSSLNFVHTEAFPKLQVLEDKQSLSSFPGFLTVFPKAIPKTNTEPQIRVPGMAL
jgi:hypothetical protein